MKKNGFAEAFNYSYEDAFVMEDVAVRHLYLNDEVNENVVNNVIYHILRYNRVDQGKPVDKRTPIILYINSPGGNLSDGFALVDAITTSITPVYTVNLGLAASAACYIFMAGDKRFAMPRSEFLIHEAIVGDLDHLSKMKDRMMFLNNDISEMIKEFVLNHSNILASTYKEHERVEWYMLPKEAQEFGYVDYIIGEDCDINSIL